MLVAVGSAGRGTEQEARLEGEVEMSLSRVEDGEWGEVAMEMKGNVIHCYMMT